MNEKRQAIEFFDEIYGIHSEGGLAYQDKYPRLRRVLEKVCKDLTEDVSIQFSNLFSRLSYVIEAKGMEKQKKHQVHSFRIKANKILHEGIQVSQNEYLTHLKGICEFIAHVYEIHIPKELVDCFPVHDHFAPKKFKRGIAFKKIRVEVVEKREDSLICSQETVETLENIVVKIDVPGINDAFTFVKDIGPGAQMNLLNVLIDDNGHFIPRIMILEPDYLVDISSIAECFKDYGYSPLEFLRSKFERAPNNKYIRLGNFANSAVDKLVYEQPDEENTARKIMIDDFQQYPVEYTACTEIGTEFKANCDLHYNNLRQVINKDFPANNISRDKITLEPSFLSEDYGIQGRLDMFESDNGHFKIIELKSGSPPWPDDGTMIKPNNLAQLYLYYQVIHSVKKIPFSEINDRIKGFILYSKPNSSNIRFDKPNLTRIQEIFNIRNRILANEHFLANSSIDKVKELILSISPESLINRRANENFLRNYIIPQIEVFRSPIQSMNSLTALYFYSYLSFVAREQFHAKTGSADYESSNGLANLWQNSFQEKKDKFEILFDLKIEENRADTDDMSLVLERTNMKENKFANFRPGDICVFYPKEKESDDVRDHQIFKCTISKIDKQSVEIRLRDKQRNLNYFDNYKKWTLEHDFLDSSFLSMYRGLYSFVSADNRKKDLILTVEKPREGSENEYQKHQLSEEQNRIIRKAINSKDYFLIWGPPGTGKTSIIIKEIVEEIASDPEKNILLLAFTNRAVDELCDAADNALGSESRCIRIGSRFSCAEKHRQKLLESKIEVQKADGGITRGGIKSIFNGHQVYISTVASISGKPDLLELVHFDIVIVDEASQILEPQIVGLLSNMKRFILVGDHKQLPAIVMQEKEKAAIEDTSLQAIGLNYLKNSLFERLYENARNKQWDWAYDQILCQGRMHQDIARFPNFCFYNSMLESANGWQSETFGLNGFDENNSMQHLLAKRDLVFFPSFVFNADNLEKANNQEAELVVQLLQSIRALYERNDMEFLPSESVGVITPYRNQIALIRTKMEEAGIPDYQDITVDTVERYQGSQRDIIILSFAISSPYQLDGIINLDDTGTVDRKLNVAITRARKQLIFTGDESLLSGRFIYFKLIQFIKSKGGLVNQGIEDVLNGKLVFSNDYEKDNPSVETYEPEEPFNSVFYSLVLDPLKSDNRTEYPELILGNSNDYNRTVLIEYGRADFDQGMLDVSASDKVNLYCYYNMRKHYFSACRIFDGYKEYFNIEASNCSNRVSFFDFGCGPATAGLAFNHFMSKMTSNFSYAYFGIDTSVAMLQKSKEFVSSELFSRDHKAHLFNSFREISTDYLEDIFAFSNLVVLNFSYFFSNLSLVEALDFATLINEFVEKYPLNKYVIVYQNPATEKRNREYNKFKKAIKGFTRIGRKTETVSYRNQMQSSYDKSETFVFEIASR